NALNFEISYEPPLVSKKEKVEGKVEHPELQAITTVPRLQEALLPSRSPTPETSSTRETAKLMRKFADKAQDFQVRIRIIEGRQLQGANIRPVVKVYVGNNSFRTRIKRGNNPFFDELDIGSVYDLPGHAVLRKWLLLYEPDDLHALAKGYLKVSIIVLAAGDEAPIDKRGTNEEDDVESNLLQPAGVLSRWVTFELKIYRAEDISHMAKGLMTNLKHMFGVDSDKNDGVDSFLEVSFAGNKFPSLCESIRFTVCERKSAIKSTPLGTTFLSISKISSTGSEDDEMPGFLPMFGPCFLNLYGSPREGLDYTEKNDELNLGKSEGVSYRGRILVELATRVEENLGKAVENLSSEDYLIVQVFVR
ncbi:hypothetical protein scyTo_0018254, partial [Scyliorhinus torazame]|nr:hypothetical protein [Scyliorhinus torazame]